MIITTKVRYAVMAVLEIWHHELIWQQNKNGKKSITLTQIAESQQISISYLEQIFACLKKANIVNSCKGPGGGYILAQNPNQITVANIVKAIGEPIKMTRCDVAKNSGCLSNKSKCKTHHLWQGLEKQICSYLDSITICSI
jgi:Rrf2 family iron-sulfur cluster assembly transcriptional regulator